MGWNYSLRSNSVLLYPEYIYADQLYHAILLGIILLVYSDGTLFCSPIYALYAGKESDASGYGKNADAVGYIQQSHSGLSG